MERIYHLTNNANVLDSTRDMPKQCGYAIVREEEGADGKPEFIAYLFNMEGIEVGHGQLYATEATALRYTKRRAGANAAEFVAQADDYNGAKVVAGALLGSDEGKYIVNVSSRDENYVDSPTTVTTTLFATFDEAWDFYEATDLRKHGRYESKKSLWRRTYEAQFGKRQTMVACSEYRHWAVEC